MDKAETAKSADIKFLIESETNQTLDKNNKLPVCPFCGSGNGENKTPAFSVSPKKNIFKCFATCGRSGNPIEFIKFYKNLDNKQAISYICEKYSNKIIVEKTNLPEKKTDLNKFIYAIRNNNIHNATEYLKQRNINTDLLTKHSYYYDSLENSVVFIDSENKLINKRFINPDSKPKAKNVNGSIIQNVIYDKCFNPELEDVYITEGVINGYSLLPNSFISIFTTQNKITDLVKLGKYCTNKNIILAFDNDKAGKECTEYYVDLLLNSDIDFTSLKVINFPESKDANDLLKENLLLEFVQNKENYTTIFNEVENDNDLLQPLIFDSEDINSDFEKKGYYIKGGCYWIIETYRKITNHVRISTFTMKILYHFVDGTQNTKRLILIQRHSGELTAIEVQSSDIKISSFETILKSYSCSFLGSSWQLNLIISDLMDSEPKATSINTLGYNSKFDIYCFSDCIINKNNRILKVNKLGIIKDNSNTFYLPAWSESKILDKHLDNERIFKYNKGQIDFKTWSDLIYKAYDINGGIGISFLIMALFRDIVFSELNFFPYLYLYGQAGVGKTSFIDFLLRLFGNKDVGVSLKNSTIKGIARTCSQKTNSIVFLKEYDNNIDKEIVAFFKNAYDGASYTIAQKSTDNKTDSFVIESGVIIDSNYWPTAESAMFDRMIVLTFDKNTFTSEKTEAYSKLKIESEKGLGQIVKELLKYREYFKKYFKSSYKELYDQIKNDNIIHSGTNVSKLPERNLKHVVFLLTPLQILHEKLSFPFSFDEILEKTLAYAIEKNEMLDELNDINIFWDSINAERDQPLCRIKENIHYVKCYKDKILYIKVKELYVFYVEYCRKNNVNSIDKSSLIALMTSPGYCFISGGQESRNSKTHYHKVINNCYRFAFEVRDSGQYILIKNKEVKL